MEPLKLSVLLLRVVKEIVDVPKEHSGIPQHGKHYSQCHVHNSKDIIFVSLSILRLKGHRRNGKARSQGKHLTFII